MMHEMMMMMMSLKHAINISLNDLHPSEMVEFWSVIHYGKTGSLDDCSDECKDKRQMTLFI